MLRLVISGMIRVYHAIQRAVNRTAHGSAFVSAETTTLALNYCLTIAKRVLGANRLPALWQA